MRQPKPWYWKARKGWYIQIQKKQIRLGADEEGGKSPPPEVMRQFHRLMASVGIDAEKSRGDLTAREVCEVFLTVKSRLRPNTYRNKAWFLKKLCEENPKRRLSTLRFADIERIAESETTWGSSTKHDFFVHVATLFKWAREAGYTEFNALAGHPNPYPTSRRERLLTGEEFRRLLDLAKDVEFKQIMIFMWGTGCRPGEARIISARHVHPERPLVILEPHEHKMGRRTGRKRVLLMPSAIDVMVRALIRQYPKGPLFRNSRNGKGWGHSALSKRFRDYRAKLGLGDDVVPYLIRHATATRWVESGIDLALVAKMLGHSGTYTLQTTYYHPDVQKMIDAADGECAGANGRH